MDSRFWGVNRHFVSSFEVNVHRTNYKGHFLRTIEIKDYNVLTDVQNFFDQLVKAIKRDIMTFEKLQLVMEIIT